MKNNEQYITYKLNIHINQNTTHTNQDCTELHTGTAFDVISGKHMPVEVDIDEVTYGFPCTDASPLNSSSSSVENKLCVIDSSLRTGGFFNALKMYVRKTCAHLNNGPLFARSLVRSASTCCLVCV